jgi:two-component system phosphate regulon sensor histidine kinase PhoR
MAEQIGSGSGTAAIVAALTDPVVIVDGALSVLLANQAARTAWPSLAVGHPLAFSLRSPDLIDAAASVLGGADPIEGTMAERVPVERLFSFRATRLQLPGRPSEALLVFQDLTEARRLERMRVDFVANASHELRTPLASLLGFIETLQGPARDDAPARERFLAIMREQARRMARLIDDLLSLSRIELSEHRRPDSLVDLVSVARQVVDTLRPLAAERGVDVQLEAGGPVIVIGERDELLRVSESLVENAIKYGEDGKRVAVTVRSETAGPGPSGVVEVRDWGPGIDRAHLPRLTERFYRIDAAASRNKGGTGLGLALVKHILNRHRGRLQVVSRPGEGATFRALIPLAPAPAQADVKS